MQVSQKNIFVASFPTWMFCQGISETLGKTFHRNTPNQMLFPFWKRNDVFYVFRTPISRATSEGQLLWVISQSGARAITKWDWPDIRKCDNFVKNGWIINWENYYKVDQCKIKWDLTLTTVLPLHKRFWKYSNCENYLIFKHYSLNHKTRYMSVVSAFK